MHMLLLHCLYSLVIPLYIHDNYMLWMYNDLVNMELDMEGIPGFYRIYLSGQLVD